MDTSNHQIKGIFTGVTISFPKEVQTKLAITEPENNPYKDLHNSLRTALAKFEREYVLLSLDEESTIDKDTKE